jgi:hypothetical protein
VKISLRFVSWLDILNMLLSGISYILFKLKEIKKSEVNSSCQYIFRLLSHKSLSPFFTLNTKTIEAYLLKSQRELFLKNKHRSPKAHKEAQSLFSCAFFLVPCTLIPCSLSFVSCSLCPFFLILLPNLHFQIIRWTKRL